MGVSTLLLLAAFVLGYLLGSIPFGLLLTRAAGLGDIRSVGSGNIGATNVLRTGNTWLAAATLILDALKGTAAAVLAPLLFIAWLNVGPASIAEQPIERLMSIGVQMAAAGGLGAFIGHIFPVWLGFRGGKGVATYIGVLLGLFWKAAVVFCAVWLAVALVTRYSSLSALVASVVTPLVVWWLGAQQLAILLAPLTLLLIYKHRANLQRLMEGKEPKIGAKA
jgi:glycerol-3-phosphate acyltransferase PlsY